MVFGILKSVTKAALNVAVAPIDVAKDLVTLGGIATDEEEPYTVKRAKTVGKHLNNAGKKVEELLEED